MLLLGACATAPKGDPEPEALLDRTRDTDYRLDAVANKLLDAEDFESQGMRGLGVVVVETAQAMLPADYAREHEYLDVVKAAIWAREGEGRDAAKSASLLEAVTASARSRDDQRLLADTELVRVVLLLAKGDKVGAARAGYTALRGFEAAQAQARCVNAARELAFQFIAAQDPATARGFARRAHAKALRLGDDELLIQACIDAGRIELDCEGDPEKYFLQAYEAAHRLDSLGWRNVVIALASDAWYSHGDMHACIRWGDRLRAREGGGLPRLEETGLYPADYITLIAQHFFAREEIAAGSARGQDAARLVLKTIESLPENEQAQWAELADKLRGGLLKPDGEK